MEKFTNSTSVLVKSAEEQLLEFSQNPDSEVVITYAEFPHFDSLFAIHLQMDNQEQISLIKKVWDKFYDLQRFQFRLYNLHRLRIIENRFELTETQKLEFLELINQLQMIELPESIAKNGIGIDGVIYTLNLQIFNINKKYTWWEANENIEVFQNLIAFLQKSIQI
jgi:hypothetical protein